MADAAAQARRARDVRAVSMGIPKFHDYANLFPMMDGQAFRDLVEDVRAHSVREHVVFLGDAILDGRNRHMAARECGIG